MSTDPTARIDRDEEHTREAEWMAYYHAEDGHSIPATDVSDADTERTGYYGPDGPTFSRTACWICRPELAPDDRTRKVAADAAAEREAEWEEESATPIAAPDDLPDGSGR